MIRNHVRISLALFIVGLITVGWASTLLSMLPASAPSALSMTPTPADTLPKPAIVRGFDSDGPVGLGLLDQRLEVLFDL